MSRKCDGPHMTFSSIHSPPKETFLARGLHDQVFHVTLGPFTNKLLDFHCHKIMKIDTIDNIDIIIDKIDIIDTKDNIDIIIDKIDIKGTKDISRDRDNRHNRQDRHNSHNKHSRHNRHNKHNTHKREK